MASTSCVEAVIERGELGVEGRGLDDGRVTTKLLLK